MADWRDKLQDHIAALDLWAVKRVNAGLDHLTAKTGELIDRVKNNTKSKAVEISKETKAKLEDIKRSVWQKLPKI
ncbi:MAG: hypothetical protein ACK421_02670 [Pseudanabaenaceae cyanobacterium]